MERKKPAKVREKPADQLCQFKGKNCLGKINGQGAVFYCNNCRDEAQKAAKKDRDGERWKELQACEDALTKYNFYQWLHDHRLTEPQLEKCIARAETPQEDLPRSRYDVYEYACKKLYEIHCLLLNPPADLPSAASIAAMIAQELLKYLEDRSRESPKDSTLKQLILYPMELQRDVGQQMSSKAFSKIRPKAIRVREMAEAVGNLLALTHSLLFVVESFRVRSFAIPHKRQSYEKKALTYLKGAEVVADKALKHYTGEQKKVADFLRCYVDLVRVQLVFDAGETEQADPYIQAAQERTTTFGETYISGQEVATLKFLSSILPAEHEMRLGNLDPAYQHHEEAGKVFGTMQWHSIETQQKLVSVKTQLALQDDDPAYEVFFQNYLALFKRYPCFEYRRHLQELKDAYDEKLPDVELPSDNKLFVDYTFTHIIPFLHRIPDYCMEGEAIHKERKEVMVLA